MGTSNIYNGPSNSTPLVPSWLESNSPSQATEQDNIQFSINPSIPNRFQQPRNNMTRFINSGGADYPSLGRALSNYITSSSGGAHQAMQRMGSSRSSGKKIYGFLSTISEKGIKEALKTLNLDGLVGQPIQEIFIALADYVCPDGGSIDEGISRDAFFNTIADLADNGITSLDNLAHDQILTVLELYIAHTIEDRLYNDIGNNVIHLPPDIRIANEIQTQITDFIRRAVADAISIVQNRAATISKNHVQELIDQMYEETFRILLDISEQEFVAI